MLNKTNSGRSVLLSAATLGLFVLPVFSGSALASEATPAELAELIARQSELLARQAQQLEAMQARLGQLESSRDTVPVASAQNPTTASTQPSAEATASGDSAAIAELQSQVALLEASQVDQSRIDWSGGGPEFISADGSRRLEIGGRLQFDTSATRGSDFEDRNISGSTARRLQLDLAGQLSERVGYKLGYDLSNNSVSMRDAYISSLFNWGGRDAELYVGNKYDDRTMDGATSSNNTWFMERNFVNEAVAPDRGSYGLGVKGKVFGNNRDWHASLAVTNGRLGGNTDRSDTTTYMSRAHWNPWHSGGDMVHLGGWGFYEDFDSSSGNVTNNINAADDFNDNVTIRSRAVTDPESSTAYGLELATSLGSFAAAAEYGQRTVDQREVAGGQSLSYDAWAVQASYFLTGEQHGYSRKSGLWRSPNIKNPVSSGGMGAFQFAVRYQELDFFDEPNYLGGEGNATTLGLNWYPNDWARVMLNYTLWDTHNRSVSFRGPDDGDTLSARLQLVF